MNNRFIKALKREPIDRTPVWIMRQAGRYLPEYRRVRSAVPDFMTLCKTPELACEVSLQPLARFDLDAAILFSDILTIPDAMGLGLSFTAGEGPRFAKPITSAVDVAQLPDLDPNHHLAYVMQTIRLLKHELINKVPLIGFAGSPWTVACYMVEGGGSKNFDVIKTMMYRDPALLTQLLERITQATINYLVAQAQAGVDALMIFDSWGGVLAPTCYPAFSGNWLQRIVTEVNRQLGTKQVPIILFSKGAHFAVDFLSQTGCAALGLDWSMHLGAVRQQTHDRVALQGNLDPAVLLASDAVIQREVARVLAEYGNGSGHIFNLGHGIWPAVDPDRVQCLVESVHTLSTAYHS